MKRLFLTALSVFSGVVCCFAQTPELPPKCEAAMPKILMSAILSEKDAEGLMKDKNFGQSNSSGKYWFVYSDRADNKTYSSPDLSSQQCGTLGFSEKVRIAKIKNGFALVYTDPNVNIEYPLISERAVSKGWVPMSKLLLWSSCLANERGIYNKALLCVNLDKSSSEKQNLGHGYKEPSTKSPSEQLATDMKFYYIMKRENGMTLLAMESKMDGSATDNRLFYWLPENSYVPWSQRSCLEQTWNRDDYNYFIQKNITAKIYESPKFDNNTKPISTIKFEKIDEKNAIDKSMPYRISGDILRYPILDNGNDRIYNMSTFSANGGAIQKEDTAKKRMIRILEKKQNINLAIVIDGTSSMGPYYPAVQKAITEGINSFFTKDTKIKVGAVIYRDYADGEYLTEVMPLTDKRDMGRLNKFLQTGGVYGVKSSPNDKTQTEALYFGLNETLDKLKFDKQESNIILVVGDCANADDDTKCPTPDVLISKIVDKEIHLMGFQVRNQSIPAFTSFNSQLNGLIRKSMVKKYQALNVDVKVEASAINNASGAKEGFRFKAPADPNGLYIGTHHSANPAVDNGNMKPENLTKCMVDEIANLAAAIQTQINILQTGIEVGDGGFSGGTGKGGSIDIDEEFLKKKFGENWKEQLGKGTLLNFKGYSPKQDASGRDFYKPVIFIGRDELAGLIKAFAGVYQAAQESNTKNREPYIEALKALVRSFAPGMTEQEMARLSNEQITAMIAGLNEAASSLKQYTLEDLSSPQVVKDAEYMRIITDFSDKYVKIKTIQNRYAFKYNFNGAEYFWIPIEDLP